MSARILLLRHGTAELRALDGRDDPERALIARGRTQCKMIANTMQRAGLVPTFCASSDYRRARQTAAAVLDALGVALPVSVNPCLRPGGSLVETEALLHEQLSEEGGETLLLVGHEPHLSSFAGQLLDSPNLALRLKKGGLIELKTERGSTTLHGLLRPRHLPPIPD